MIHLSINTITRHTYTEIIRMLRGKGGGEGGGGEGSPLLW